MLFRIFFNISYHLQLGVGELFLFLGDLGNRLGLSARNRWNLHRRIRPWPICVGRFGGQIQSQSQSQSVI